MTEINNISVDNRHYDRNKSQKTSYDKKQQQMLDIFYKDFFDKKDERIAMFIVVGIFEGIQCIFMWFPYQEIRESGIETFIFLSGIMGAMFYLFPYIQYNEEGKSCRIYQKLKYLPVSFQAIRRYRLQKLTMFSLRVYAIALIGQLFFSLVCFHEITLGNFLYPTICGFLIPYGVNGITCWWSK